MTVTVVFQSFDVFELLILTFDKDISVWNFPWSLVFLIFYFLCHVLECLHRTF